MNIGYNSIIDIVKRDILPLYDKRGRYYHNHEHVFNILKNNICHIWALVHGQKLEFKV